MDTCPYVPGLFDDLLWTAVAEDESWKTVFASELNMQEDHWRHGWGWQRLDDHERPFAKMYMSAWLLRFGVDESSLRWRAHLTAGNPAAPNATFHVLPDGMIHIFYRTPSDELNHESYYFDSPQDRSQQGEAVSATAVSPLGSNPPSFSGRVVIVRPPPEAMRVLGLPGQTFGHVLLFEQSNVGRTGSWRWRTLASIPDPPNTLLMVRNPVVVSGVEDIFNVFGVNDQGDIVEFFIGTQGSERHGPITYSGSSEKFAGESGSLSSFRDRQGVLHIFAANDPDGDLIHFFRPPGATVFQKENISEVSSPGLSLGWYSRVAARETAVGELVVFGYLPGGHMGWFGKGVASGCLVPGSSPQWKAKDITADSDVVPERAIGVTPPIQCHGSIGRAPIRAGVCGQRGRIRHALLARWCGLETADAHPTNPPKRELI